MPIIEPISETPRLSVASISSPNAKTGRTRRRRDAHLDLQDEWPDSVPEGARGPAKLRTLTALALPKLSTDHHESAACQTHFEDALLLADPEEVARLSERNQARVHLSNEKNFKSFLDAFPKPSVVDKPFPALPDAVHEAAKALAPIQNFLSHVHEPWDFSTLERFDEGRARLVTGFTDWFQAINQCALSDMGQIRLRQNELVSPPEPHQLMNHIDELSKEGRISLGRTRALNEALGCVVMLGSNHCLQADLAPVTTSTRHTLQEAQHFEDNFRRRLDDETNHLATNAFPLFLASQFGV